MSGSVQKITTVYDLQTSDFDKLEAKFANLLKLEQRLAAEGLEMADSITKANTAGNKFANDGENAGKRVEGAFKGVNQQANILGGSLPSIGKMLGGIFVVDKLLNFGKEVVNLQGRLQKMEAVLTNTLGSKSAAMQALEMIQDFAKKTPFALEEITEAYIKLANRGIKPSIEQLTKMGDVASSLGKPLEDVNEALLDVSNTERWNELGIKVQASGDSMKGTFKGVTVEVDKTEAGALKMLETFGELPGVAGTMAAVAGTIEGKISNLDDVYNQFIKSVTGSGSLIAGGLDTLTGALTAITETINDYNNSLDGVLEVSGKVISSNKQQAGSAQSLLNEYESLTAKGVKPTAEQKQRLDIITLKLRDSLGESVVAIDKETGALTLNKDAVKEAIKQRLLLANQEASTLALRANKIKEDVESAKAVVRTEKAIFETRLQELKKFGLSVENEQKIRDGKSGLGQIVSKSDKQAVEAASELSVARQKLAISIEALSEKESDHAAILAKLNELGFTAVDVENLFAEATQKTTENKAKEKEKLGELGLLQEEQTKINERLIYQSGEALKSDLKRLDQINKEIDAIKERALLQKAPDKVSTIKSSFDPKLQKAALDELTQLEVDRATESLEKQKHVRDLGIKEGGILLKQSKEEIEAELEQSEFLHLTELRKLYKEYGLDTAKLDQEIADLKVEGYEKDVEANKKALEQKNKDDKEYADKKKELEKELQERRIEIAYAAADAFISVEQSRLDGEMRASQESMERELEKAGENKDAKLAIERRFEAEQKAIQKEQDQLEAKAALFNILANTAEKAFAIKAQAAVLASNPITIALAPMALAQLPFLFAASAIQALAVTASIPQYFLGTSSAEPGPGIWGELGTELMIDKSGKMELSPSKPTFKIFKGGETIIPADETAKFLSQEAIMPDFGAMSFNQPDPINYDILADKVGNRIDKSMRKITIERHVKDDRGYRVYEERENQRIERMEKKRRIK